MAGFAKFGDIDGDKIGYSMWRKTTSQTSAVQQWYDDSMLAGVPPANFYATSPLEAATLDPNRGIRHWVPGSFSEHLLEILTFGNAGTLEAPSSFLLCDYLLYYPFIDGDSPDQQDFVNTVTLPRYTDGKGLRMMLVSQGPGATTGAYSVNYIGQDDAPGNSVGTTTTPTTSGHVITGIGATNRMSPFLPLATGHHGIKSVTDITWTTPPGGIAALVIVKPIAPFVYAEIGTAAETVFHPRMPEVNGNAYLGLLRNPNGATPAARVLSGMLTTVRS